ncbi:MAG: hypothetical protein J1E81_01140 [Eubacterium sp.]|nr:hypothetical protein [Eubacterium sp.]
MTSFQLYKRKLIIKALVIPTLAALIFSGILIISLPRIQNALPNSTEYSVQNDGVESDV